jgi:hypothetical protein
VPGPGSGALGHTRAGAVASRMARAGTATWIATGRSRQHSPSPGAFTTPPTAKATAANGRKEPQSPARTAQPAPAKTPGTTDPQSVSAPDGAVRPARRSGTIGGGGTPSQNGHGANPVRPETASPATGAGGRDQRPAPGARPTPPPPTSRHSSSPPPRPPAPSRSPKRALGGDAPADKGEPEPGKRSARRLRRNLKRGGR